MSRALTQASVRALKMTPEARDTALSRCSPEIKGKIENELSAIEWVTLTCLIWHEHGVLDEILDYLKDRCEADSPSEVPA